jgi:hypothetical protein
MFLLVWLSKIEQELCRHQRGLKTGSKFRLRSLCTTAEFVSMKMTEVSVEFVGGRISDSSP